MTETVVEQIVRTKADLEAIIENVSFERSCVDMDWGFDIEEITLANGDTAWMINTSFMRPDTYFPHEIKRGKGRQELITSGTTESGVVKTIFVLCKMILEHEMMEALKYKDERPFDPHNQVSELGAVSQRRRLAEAA